MPTAEYIDDPSRLWLPCRCEDAQANLGLRCALTKKRAYPVSILQKSIAGRYRPVRVADGPITARCRFIKNASWEFPVMIRTLCAKQKGRMTLSGSPEFMNAYLKVQDRLPKTRNINILPSLVPTDSLLLAISFNIPPSYINVTFCYHGNQSNRLISKTSVEIHPSIITAMFIPGMLQWLHQKSVYFI